MKDLQEYYKYNLKGIEVGDNVFDLAYGYGVVDSILEIYTFTDYSMHVVFDNGERRTYTIKGLLHRGYPIPSLFFEKPNFDENGYPIPQKKEKKIDFLKWLNGIGCSLAVYCHVNVEALQESWYSSISYKSETLFYSSGTGKIESINNLIKQISGCSIMRSYVQIDIPSNFALIKEEK